MIYISPLEITFQRGKLASATREVADKSNEEGRENAPEEETEVSESNPDELPEADGVLTSDLGSEIGVEILGPEFTMGNLEANGEPFVDFRFLPLIFFFV